MGTSRKVACSSRFQVAGMVNVFSIVARVRASSSPVALAWSACVSPCTWMAPKTQYQQEGDASHSADSAAQALDTEQGPSAGDKANAQFWARWYRAEAKRAKAVRTRKSRIAEWLRRTCGTCTFIEKKTELPLFAEAAQTRTDGL